MIASIAGELSGGKLSDCRPFRAPHHSASMAAMVGGGLRARPGEVSLAHNGVLFLDEFPEFSPQVLDSLRQPLETGECMIARVNHRTSYPARFQLIAAMNPCRCGMAGEPGHTCARGPRCQSDYQARISGPLLDRIDLRVDMPAVSALDLIQPSQSERSESVAKRVARARAIQSARYAALGLDASMTNANCSANLIEEVARPDAAGVKLLRDASEQMRFSARAYHRILKVAALWLILTVSIRSAGYILPVRFPIVWEQRAVFCGVKTATEVLILIGSVCVKCHGAIVEETGFAEQ